jgi:hypothetical protein
MYLNKNIICITITTCVALFLARSLYKWECPFLVKKNKEEVNEEHAEVYYETEDIKPEDIKPEDIKPEDIKPEDIKPEQEPQLPQFTIKPQLSVPSGLYFQFGNVNQTNQ